MKIIVTTAGDDLSSPMDKRFGRAPKFLLFDTEDGSFTTHDNKQNMNAAQGAGIQAAECVAKLGAAAVITGHCGPKAFRALGAAGIKVYNCDAATVAEAIELYGAGKLREAASADSEGHWI